MAKNATWLRAGVVCAALIWGFGCGDDEPEPTDAGDGDAGDGDGDGDGDGGAAIDLTVATYNAGLLATVGFVPERQPLVNEAVAELEADLVCMQEMWLDEHWDALAEASEATRPETFRLDALPGVEGDCTADELEPLEMCAELMCGDVGVSELFSCTVEMCGAEVEVLSTTCTACLVDNMGSDLETIANACRGTGMASDEPLPPEERAYLLGGSFGTGILSSLPLSETDSLLLDSSTTRRAVLHAKIDAPGLGEVSVFCTHLSAVLNEVRYEGSFEDWEGENTAQVAEMIEWIDEKAGANGKVIVLGDLNTSPEAEADGIVAEVEDSYAQLPAAGFESAFLEGDNAACTFCTNNPLVRGDDTGTGGAIDHILTRNITADVSIERIFTELVDVMGDEDAGVPDELPLSDHYGLRAVLR